MINTSLNVNKPMAGAAADAKAARTPTFTPAIWVMLWVCMTAGYIVGFVDAAAIDDSPATSTTYILDFYAKLAASFSGGHADIAQLVDQPCTYPELCGCKASQKAHACFVATRMLATAVVAVPGAWLSRMAGRRVTMMAGTSMMLIGLSLQAAAFHWGQLLAGVIPIGLGMSLVLQAVWIECAEIAPPKWRASLLACFSLSRQCGLWVSLVCVQTLAAADLKNGWRTVLALGGWPTLVMLFLAFWLPDTPNSLIQRGRLAEGREVLTIIRGPFYDCNKELLDIWKSAGRPSAVMGSKIHLMIDNFRQLRQPSSLPPLLVGVLIAFFMESTGTYQLLGHALSPLMAVIYPNQGILRGAAIVGASAVFGVLLSTAASTKLSPKTMITAGTATVAASWLFLGLLLRYSPATGMTATLATIGLAVFAINVGAGAGGLVTMFPVVVTENQPLATRAHAVAIAIAVNCLMQAVITVSRAFFLCRMKEKAFFTAMISNLLVLAITVLLLPNTKHLPLEVVHTAWAQHWLWRRCYQGPTGEGSRFMEPRHVPELMLASADEPGTSGSSTHQQQQQQQLQQLRGQHSGLALVHSGGTELLLH